MLAGIFLLLSLVSFVIQTETAVYIQHELGWKKAYSMLYLTHGSWAVLWPVQLLILKIQKPKVPWGPFLRAHFHLLRSTAQMVMCGTPRLSPSQSRKSPTVFIIRKVVFITCALTIAGSTWYVAVNMTTPSDLTAIYNCSAFFAYVFSIFMLHEKPRKDKIFAVAVAIAGVLIVAYGDTSKVESGHELEAQTRVWGNVIIGIGSVLYGFYEVLYKKMACPPEGTSPGRSVIFANAVGTGIGMFTLFVLWIPIPILHVLGYEKFELPHGEAAWMLAISVFANATFSGSFLVLISLTSPVLSSVASLLTIFLVAITDWFLNGTPISFAALVGGLLIIGAFLLLSWSTWVEMNEEEKSKEFEADITSSSSDDD
jgi:drug/metabolite transporter (DMT)-like permease